jgi:3-hydroxyisobutyrate dehydrogenase
MVNQILIGPLMIGLCEGLLYARRSGLDVATVLESVSGGAAGSWSLTNYVPRIERGDLEPGFMIEHFVKDLRIAIAESKRMGLTLPGLALAERLYTELAEAGHGRKGIQALLLALDRVA